VTRGVADAAVLPHYPFRDDGMLVWDALHKFISAYLKHFYPSDSDVESDNELQAWASELKAMEGGYVGGFPKKIATLQEYIELITTILFQVGPYHSAVNFLQYEYQTLSSNMPTAMYADPEVVAKKDIITREDIMNLLPSFGAMAEQFSVAVRAVTACLEPCTACFDLMLDMLSMCVCTSVESMWCFKSLLLPSAHMQWKFACSFC
jgi:arachidonate 15-lipoxygenase